MIQGIPIETIYLYVLIVCAVIAVLLVIFGDIFDFDGPIDPMLLIPWLAFTSLFGYLGERLFEWDHLLLFLASGVIASILVFFLNFYVLMPMKNAEATISISEKDMEGNTATVITPIPVGGMGEIQLKSVTGSISRPAAFYSAQDQPIEQGEQVLIIEIRERVCYVVPYKGSLQL
ncbi:MULTISPECIES: NfeD family protein [Enterococcus]|uniref:NfeD family protein n=1 Tax=Enterococcus TaxID=1350 RepID=UPI001A91EC1A|nr:NfeD family protein [Enterococcus ureilyticus]MBO0447733.1 NfeD family protein [Enterococcus ureilyticus]